MPNQPRQKPKTPFSSVPPGVVPSPRAMRGFQRGITALAEAIRPTLGPFPRLVAFSRTHPGEAPELLDDGGLIARRLVALPDRDADMGAMYLRHVLWRLREDVGDGTATAAVLFKAIYDGGVRQITAGFDAMRLREALEATLPTLLDALTCQSVPLRGEDALRRFARVTCPDAETADLLAEIYEVIGENGHVEMINARGQRSEREYIEGAFWESGLASRSMVNDPGHLSARLEKAAILVTDLEINDAQSLVPVLRAAVENGHTALALIARKFSDDAAALLVNASRSGRLAIAGIKTPGTGGVEQYANLQDLTTLVGGRAILSATGDDLANIQASDFGLARRVWADQEYFGIIGGQGDPLARRQAVNLLKSALAASDSADARRNLRTRIARLMGGTARLLVGGTTQSEQQHRRSQAERASLIIQAALQEGVLPGGGAAYIACQSALTTLAAPGSQAAAPEQVIAIRILQKALEQPAQTIAANAGFDLHGLLPGQVFDARTGTTVDIATAGIFDAAGVLKAALIAAVKGAALALTIDVLIHHANPQYSPEP